MTDKHFYITTTLPYVNSDPHIGFAMELVRADVIARYKKIQGYDVFFNTGTDEHGQKIYQKAQAEGKDTQVYVDEYAEKFRNLIVGLGVLPAVNFVRTTDEHHIMAAQEFWKRCKANGYIEKRNYQTKYCIGCELEKTDSELDDNGHCPIHPAMIIDLRDEENYFFRFSAFSEKLLALYNSTPDFVVPAFRFNEIRSFVERGLEDFSISRLKIKMPWGIPVPDDSEHVMYVWFDALVNYVSTIGWPDNEIKFNTWWPAVQYCGKDNLRQQTAMWQAMLLAAGLSPSQQIIVEGFINVDGKKMSKSSGTTVNPYDIITEYNSDVFRYYVVREMHPFEDSDYTEQKFKDSYNANLANGLGNLISRVLKMSETYFGGQIGNKSEMLLPIKTTVSAPVGHIDVEGVTLQYFVLEKLLPRYNTAFAAYDLQNASDGIWELIRVLDHYVTHYEPYKLVKTDKEKTEGIIWNLLYGLAKVALFLEPIMPVTAERLTLLLGATNSPDGEPVTFHTGVLSAPLFVRKE